MNRAVAAQCQMEAERHEYPNTDNKMWSNEWIT